MIRARLSAAPLLALVAAAGTVTALRAAGPAVITHPVVPEVYDGAWMVSVVAEEGDEYTVLDADGRPVAGPFAAQTFCVPEACAWTAESPVCYRLAADGADGRRETVFGFCEKTIRGDRFFVNGTPVRLKLGPKELNGNAAGAFDCTPDAAWTNGVYRLAESHLARVEVMKPRATPAATRHYFQDWSVKATNYCQRIAVANRCSFLSAAAVTLRWTLLVDGVGKADGVIDLCGLKAGQESAFDMPPEVTAARSRPGTVSVRFAFLREGVTVAEDQIDLVASREVDALWPPRRGWLDACTFGLLSQETAYSEATEEGARVRRFTTDRTLFTFSDEGNREVTFAKRGLWSDELLVSGVSPVRERPVAGGWLEMAYPPRPVSSRDGALSFSDLREVGGLVVAERWTVLPDGTVACRARLKDASPAPAGDPKERLGVALSLPRRPPSAPWFFGRSQPGIGSDVAVEWFGLGPESTSPDLMEGAFLGRWKTTAENRLTAEGVRGIRVGGLTVRTLGAPFAVDLCGEGGSRLLLLGEPDGKGAVDLAFTLSADDDALTARAPGDDEPLDFPNDGEQTSNGVN